MFSDAVGLVGRRPRVGAPWSRSGPVEDLDAPRGVVNGRSTTAPCDSVEGVVGERAPAVETTGERSGQSQSARFENVPGLRVFEPLLTRHMIQFQPVAVLILDGFAAVPHPHFCSRVFRAMGTSYYYRCESIRVAA